MEASSLHHCCHKSMSVICKQQKIISWCIDQFHHMIKWNNIEEKQLLATIKYMHISIKVKAP